MAKIETRILDHIMGHQATLESLFKLVREERLSSTYLFCGPNGVGKRMVARALAQAIVCESADKPCGVCGACIRIYKSGSESLLEIEPKGPQLKIDQAKEVIEFCQLAHHGARIIIIDQAEKLNPQAANILLKLLEEPPPRTFFFLMVPSLQSVLPTIRSRSQILRFGLLPKEELHKKLMVPAWIIESSGGRMDQIEALQSEETLELRAKAKTWLEYMLNSQVEELVHDLKGKSTNRDEAVYIAKFWREYMRDIWFSKLNLSPLIHSDQHWDPAMVSSLTDDRLDGITQSLDELDRGLRGSADVSLSLEYFLRAQ